MRHQLTVSVGETPKRLDRYLVSHERDLSRARVQRLIRLGRVQVNGRRTKAAHRVRGGDCITFESPPAGPLMRNGAPQFLEILHEDEELLVINKPADVAMHPGSGHWSGTILNALLYYLANTSTNQGALPGLVHRLDKGTSGVLAVAKTLSAHRTLSCAFSQHRIDREYHALVYRVPAALEGMIDRPLGRHRVHTFLVSTETDHPVRATTTFTILKSFGQTASLLKLRPLTGRTHQLRAHLSWLGHPILGDARYPYPAACPPIPVPTSRLMLHASVLVLPHPKTGVYHRYESPLPAEMREALNFLGRGHVSWG